MGGILLTPGVANTPSGPAGGDLTGLFPNPDVATVGGSTAADIHSAELLANAATNSATANTIVKRDGAGHFTATNFTGNLTGEVTSVGMVTTVSNAAVIAKVLTGYVSSAGVITPADTILSAIEKMTGNINAAGAPGGANLELQFNNNGIFDGTTGITFSGGNLNLGAHQILNTRLTNFANGVTPATPSVGSTTLFVDSSDGHTKQINDAGMVIDLTATGSGTVTSVSMTVPGFLSVTGSPVTTSGTLAVTLANQTASTVFAGPVSGGAAAPTFRALVDTDIPASLSATTFTGAVIGTEIALSSGITLNSSGSGDINLAHNSFGPGNIVNCGTIQFTGVFGSPTLINPDGGSFAIITNGQAIEFISDTGIKFEGCPLVAMNAGSGFGGGLFRVDAGSIDMTTSVNFLNGVAPAAPPAASTTLYVDTADGHTKQIDENGVIIDLAANSGGTVTSVALTTPSFLSVAGSPVTTSGTLAVTLATQAANRVFVGPTAGGAAIPTFRALVAADIPLISLTTGVSGTLPIANGGTNATTALSAFNNLSPLTTAGDLLYGGALGSGTRLPLGTAGQILTVVGGNPVWAAPATNGTVTSVALSAPAIFTVGGSPVTTSGTLSFSLNSQSQNLFLASPNGSAGTPTFRSILAADLPSISLTSGVSGILPIANGGTGQSSATNAFNALSPITNKADLISSDGSNAVRLPVGTDGFVLTADSAQTTGLKWSAVSGTGTVTSVALTVPGFLSVAGSPVTTSGTLAVTLATQTANTVFAGPAAGGAATPTFRALVAADIPTISLTSGVSGILPIANGGTGQSTQTTAFNALSPITTKADLISSNGTNNVRLAVGTDGFVLTADSAQATGLKWSAVSGTGTVTSVALTVPGFLSVAGSPVTTSGTLAVSLATQTANTVFAGPAAGGAATPTFRTLVAADIPAISLTTGVSGILPIANGGTGQSTQTTAFNALSPITTKGDLISSDGTNNVRLPVGSNGQVLQADSTQTAGVKWAASTSGIPNVQADPSPTLGGPLNLAAYNVLVNSSQFITGAAGAFALTDTTANATFSIQFSTYPYLNFTLTGAQTNAALSILDLSIAKGYTLEYLIFDPTTNNHRIGTLFVCVDQPYGTAASVASFADTFTETGAGVGVTWSVTTSLGFIHLFYTTTAGNKTMSCKQNAFYTHS